LQQENIFLCTKFLKDKNLCTCQIGCNPMWIRFSAVGYNGFCVWFFLCRAAALFAM
jgi:hypothetical protein